MFWRKTVREGGRLMFGGAVLDRLYWLPSCTLDEPSISPLRASAFTLAMPGMLSFRYLHQLLSHFTQGSDHPGWGSTLHHSILFPLLFKYSLPSDLGNWGDSKKFFGKSFAVWTLATCFLKIRNWRDFKKKYFLLFHLDTWIRNQIILDSKRYLFSSQFYSLICLSFCLSVCLLH